MLIQILQFVLGLSILIVLHEFGHYLPARFFGVRVTKFYLFFDYKFSLFKKKIGGAIAACACLQTRMLCTVYRVNHRFKKVIS